MYSQVNIITIKMKTVTPEEGDMVCVARVVVLRQG